MTRAPHSISRRSQISSRAWIPYRNGDIAASSARRAAAGQMIAEARRISPAITRSYWQRSGVSIPRSFSTAMQKPTFSSTAEV